MLFQNRKDSTSFSTSGGAATDEDNDDDGSVVAIAVARKKSSGESDASTSLVPPSNAEDVSGGRIDKVTMDRVVSVADSLSVKERFTFICSLWPYMTPLLVVYVSEYALQSGVWTAFALPSTAAEAAVRVKEKSKRDFAYKAFNLTYQIGVFVSRSSGLIFQPNVATLWAMPTLQCGFWILFYAIAVDHFWYGWTLLAPAFVVGLLGGAVYVNAFTLIDKNLLPEYRELALSATAFACDAGILIGNVAGLLCQFCLFSAMDIHVDDSGTCPF